MCQSLLSLHKQRGVVWLKSWHLDECTLEILLYLLSCSFISKYKVMLSMKHYTLRADAYLIISAIVFNLLLWVNITRYYLSLGRYRVSDDIVLSLSQDWGLSRMRFRLFSNNRLQFINILDILKLRLNLLFVKNDIINLVYLFFSNHVPKKYLCFLFTKHRISTQSMLSQDLTDFSWQSS